MITYPHRPSEVHLILASDVGSFGVNGIGQVGTVQIPVPWVVSLPNTNSTTVIGPSVTVEVGRVHELV